jgi:predicted DNA-binding transcriptional regulator AlpA
MATAATDGMTGVPPPSSGAGLLIDIQVLSGLLDRSVASLERDQAAGRLPAPVYVGGSRRWRRAEIVAWVAAGCPTRVRWDEIRSGTGPVTEPKSEPEDRT